MMSTFDYSCRLSNSRVYIGIYFKSHAASKFLHIILRRYPCCSQWIICTGGPHQVDVNIIMCGSEIRAKVLARVSLLRFPLSELHNQPLLLLLLDLLGNNWVPDSDLGFHLPAHGFPSVVQVKAVMDHALGLQWSKFDLSSSDQSV